MDYSPWGHKKLDTTEQLVLSLFIYLAALGLSCCMHDLHCLMGEFPLQGTHSLVVAVGSAVAVCGLSCPMACGILVSRSERD